MLFGIYTLYVAMSTAIVRIGSAKATTATVSGRLEVLTASGTWASVCDDYYDSRTSKVVCKTLGYTGEALLPLLGCKVVVLTAVLNTPFPL